LTRLRISNVAAAIQLRIICKPTPDQFQLSDAYTQLAAGCHPGLLCVDISIQASTLRAAASTALRLVFKLTVAPLACCAFIFLFGTDFNLASARQACTMAPSASTRLQFDCPDTSGTRLAAAGDPGA